MARHHNPDVGTFKCIQELIEIARDLRAEREEGPVVDERAVHDAFAQNASAVGVVPRRELLAITAGLVGTFGIIQRSTGGTATILGWR